MAELELLEAQDSRAPGRRRRAVRRGLPDATEADDDRVVRPLHPVTIDEAEAVPPPVSSR